MIAQPSCKLVLTLVILGIVCGSLIIGLILRFNKTTDEHQDTEPPSTVVMTIAAASSTTRMNHDTGTCLNRSCLRTPIELSDQLTAFWSFDSTILDSINRWPAIPNTHPIYFAGFAGSGQCLFFDGINQFLRAPFIPLHNRSFTIQMFVFSNRFPSDAAFVILNQCATPAAQRYRCLTLAINRSRVMFSFFGDDQLTSTRLTYNQWYHLSFVFDSVNLRRRIYVDGELMNEMVIDHTYERTAGDTVIGAAAVPEIQTSMKLTGYVDSLLIYSGRVKSSCEIRNEAKLLTYMSFDGGSFVDDGPHQTQVVPVGSVGLEQGVRDRGAALVSSGSYLVMYGYLVLGYSDHSFAISLWVKPYELGGTLVHLSGTQYGSGYCISLLGLSSTGMPSSIIYTSSGSKEILSPTNVSVPINQWTHLAITFSIQNGLRLFVNGTLVAQGRDRSFYTAGQKMYLLFGAYGSAGGYCQGGDISPGQFYGGLDEIRVHNDDLSMEEVCSLAQ